VQDNASREHWKLSNGAVDEIVTVPMTLLSKSGGATHAASLAGTGIALLAAWEVLDDLDAGRLVRVLPQWSSTPDSIQLVFPGRAYQPRRLKVFVDFLQAELNATMAMLGDRAPF
jgi:DNA-binding transcriptional LysR family regulator